MPRSKVLIHSRGSVAEYVFHLAEKPDPGKQMPVFVGIEALDCPVEVFEILSSVHRFVRFRYSFSQVGPPLPDIHDFSKIIRIQIGKPERELLYYTLLERVVPAGAELSPVNLYEIPVTESLTGLPHQHVVRVRIKHNY